MQYDGKNTRLLMSYGGKATSYLQDGAAGLPVVLQEVVSGQNPSSFLYPRGSTSPLYQDNLWYHSDGLGSLRALTSASTGAIVETNSYSAFGLNVGQSGNTHGFAGEQLDPTGLYFNRARYYNPTIGRFTTRDDFSMTPKIPSSINRYIFVENDPTQLIDPSGYFSRPPNSVPRTPLCQSCGCRIDLVLDTAHLYIEFNDRCTEPVVLLTY